MKLTNEKAKTGSIIETVSLKGQEQMSFDLMMLETVIKEKNMGMIIRFYYWDGWWLSIGKNQKDLPRKWFELEEQKIIKLIRRPTGGTAVLHGGGLTYSIAWKSPFRKRKEAYSHTSKWLIKIFSSIGMDLRFGNDLLYLNTSNCFATSTYADLIDSSGNKRIGSAQYWRQGCLLQHGEILLDPPQKLWSEIFNTVPPSPAPSKVPRKDLDKKLQQKSTSYWSNCNWEFQNYNQWIKAKNKPPD